MLTIYGIKSCDKCRKARKWLETQGLGFHFHDLRTDGLDETLLRRWADSVGWRTLLNTRSTTWRGLPGAEKQDVDEHKAIELMLAHPTLVKRPIAETGGDIVVGFTPDQLGMIAGQKSCQPILPVT